MGAGRLILVSGGSGYVARCLVPALLEKGYTVRVLVRDPARLDGCPWRQQVQVAVGDLLSPASLEAAMQGVSAAYYLVHNMSYGRNYTGKEIESAQNFAGAAARAGVEHIIYLGGLADPQAQIGTHMRSRLNTGEALRLGPVPVTEFRASLIIGSGSISFEMIRYLTEQLPLAVGRDWVRNHAQAIAIRNVLDYLLLALELPESRGKVYEIGGRDVHTYAETMLIYARLRGLRRSLVPLPWLPVSMMAALAGSLTPVPASIAGPLIDGMRSDSTVKNELALRDFPQVQLLGYGESVEQALAQLSPGYVRPAWKSGALTCKDRREGFFVEACKASAPVSAQALYQVLTSMGGRSGWPALNFLWQLRGVLDKLFGGPGLRGRPEALKEGDVLDYYHVERLEPERCLLLKADLKAPGQGWMEWRITPEPGGTTSLEQVAYFAPRGLLGFIYWYSLLPIHRLVFAGLLKAILRRAAWAGSVEMA